MTCKTCGLGSNGNHTVDQKKHHTIAHVKKEVAIEMDLGSHSLLAQGPDALIATLEAENAQKISNTGGITVWNQMPVSQQVT